MKKSVLILNSPDISSMKIESKEIKYQNNYFHGKFNIPIGKKIFIYLGILSRKGRGLDLILDVFSSSDINEHVVFVGYGSMKNKIDEFSKSFSNIHYHSPVPHTSVVEISRSADVGLCLIEDVSLSDFYSLPNKLFEYAFSGLHVIGSEFPDIEKIINDYALGTTCKLENISLKNAINEIINKSVKNNQKDLMNLTWESQEKKLINAYRELFNR